MADGRAEGSSAIGDGGQAAVSLTVDVAGTDSVSLLDSSLFQFSRSVMSDSLRPNELQHSRPPCPSPTPRVYPNSCAMSQ